MPQPFGCTVFGHDLSFRAHGRTMVWECTRGCGTGGSKEYPTAADARRFAASFDQRDNRELGRRAPLIGLLPLRIWYRLKGRSRPRPGAGKNR